MSNKLFKKWSKISIYHYIKLIFRSILLLLAGLEFIFCKIGNEKFFLLKTEHSIIILMIIWFIYMIEMFLRMWPSSIESMGCQKQFKRNVKGMASKKAPKTGNVIDLLIGHRARGRILVVLIWVALNGIIGLLYYFNIIDDGILMLISLFYSVCDMVCILFFCPFQTWFMKNRCCVNCYIYNWDYAMMFTPLIFIPHWYTYSLICMAIIVVVQWEFLIRKYPERFDRRLNDSLKCKNCTEKLCKHKKQLQKFIIKIEKTAKVGDNALLNKILGADIIYDEEDKN